MSDQARASGEAPNSWPTWYCFVGGQMLVWRNHAWEPVASAPGTGGIEDKRARQETSTGAVLWYWDGKRWIAPGEPGDPVADGKRRPKFGLGLVVAFVAASAWALLTWLIGDRLDWAVCPGQDCNARSINWADAWVEFLIVGLISGVVVTFFEWLARWVNAKLRPRPPMPD